MGRAPCCRCIVFGGLAVLTGFSPQPFFTADPAFACAMWVTTALYVLGPLVYAARWPEKWRPGFDVLGASHQWMHVIILGAAILNGYAHEASNPWSVVARNDPRSLPSRGSWCMERALSLREVVLGTCDESV